MKKDIHENIEVFNHIVLHVLVKLYDSFPKPIDLDSTKIGLDARPDENDRNELWQNIELSDHTLSWLEQEGFVTIESPPAMSSSCYSGVRLTLKGLTLLGYVPASVLGDKDKETLISKAKSVVSRAAEQSATDVVGKLFMLAVGYLPKVIG